MQTQTHTNPVLVHHAMPLFVQNMKVKAFEVDACGYTVLGWNGDSIIRSTNIVDGLIWLWYQGLDFHIPLCGKYSLSIRPRKAKYPYNLRFDAVMVVVTQLAPEHYQETEYYNCLEGYWYLPEYRASKQAKDTLKTYPIQSIFNVLRIFNDAKK